MLTSDHHAVTPSCGFTIWHTFNDPEVFITQEIIIYSLLPVKGHRSGSVACLGWSSGVNMDPLLEGPPYLEVHDVGMY